MLEAASPKTINQNRIRKEISSPSPSTPRNYPSHVLTLDLSPSYSPSKPSIDPAFKTFYNATSRSWRVSHLRAQHNRNLRDSASTGRQTIVGTPFTVGEITEKDGNTVIPLFDG